MIKKFVLFLALVVIAIAIRFVANDYEKDIIPAQYHANVRRVAFKESRDERHFDKESEWFEDRVGSI